MKPVHLVGVLLVLAVIASYLFLRLSGKTAEPEQNLALNNETRETIADCMPAFADGGGPYYRPNSPFRNNIAPEDHDGEKLIVKGKVLKGDCETVVNGAVLDIWQANETGEYENDWYRGQVRTDDEGNYMFETVVPKGYGEGTGYRPPHIHFKVFIEDEEIITSQMFFPEVEGTPGFDEAFIMHLETDRSGNLVVHTGTHDIILPI